MFNRMFWTICPLTFALTLATLVEMALSKTAKAVTTATAAMSDTLAQPVALPPPIASTALSYVLVIIVIAAVVSVTVCLARKARSL